MKKTLIAVAALATAAGAMADLKITGEVDTTVRLSDDGKNSTTNVGRDGRGTTAIYFQGDNDLGDGLKAIYLYEHDFDPQAQAGSFPGGEKFAGLQGNFGTLRLGTPNTVTWSVQAFRNGMFGTKDGGRGGAGGTTASVGGNTLFGIAETRYDGAIRYDTPSFNGLSASLNYVPATEKKGTADGQKVDALTDIGLIFKNGPLNAGVSFNTRGENKSSLASAQKTMDAAQAVYDALAGAQTPAQQKTYDDAVTAYESALTAGLKRDVITVGIQYDFGVVLVGAGWHKLKYDGEDNNSGFNVHAAVPLSDSLKLGLNYQSLKFDKDEDGDALGEDRTQIAVGLDYSLSKNTAIYARYVAQSFDKNTDDITTTLFGLSVKF